MAAATRSDGGGDAAMVEMASRLRKTPFAWLRVTVVEATGPIARGRSSSSSNFQSSHLYCILKLFDSPQCQEAGMKKHRTSTMYETSSPKWNESFEFSIGTSNPQLHIEIYDEDSLTEDDSLGTVKIDIMALFPAMAGYTFPGCWFSVLEPQDAPEGAQPREHCGRLCLKLHWECYGWYEHFQLLALLDADKIYAPLTKFGSVVEKVWSSPFEYACVWGFSLLLATCYWDHGPAMWCMIFGFIFLSIYPPKSNAPAPQEEPLYDYLLRLAREASEEHDWKGALGRIVEEVRRVVRGHPEEASFFVPRRYSWRAMFAAVLCFFASTVVILPPFEETEVDRKWLKAVLTISFLMPSATPRRVIGSLRYFDFKKHRSQVLKLWSGEKSNFNELKKLMGSRAGGLFDVQQKHQAVEEEAETERTLKNRREDPRSLAHDAAMINRHVNPRIVVAYPGSSGIGVHCGMFAIHVIVAVMLFGLVYYCKPPFPSELDISNRVLKAFLGLFGLREEEE